MIRGRLFLVQDFEIGTVELAFLDQLQREDNSPKFDQIRPKTFLLYESCYMSHARGIQ